MAIKQLWITEHRRHVYVLTILDTLTTAVLHWSVGCHMKQSQIKAAFEQVIIDHLQPADQLAKGVQVEFRNDKGPQFSAQTFRNSLNKIILIRYLLIHIHLKKMGMWRAFIRF